MDLDVCSIYMYRSRNSSTSQTLVALENREVREGPNPDFANLVSVLSI